MFKVAYAWVLGSLLTNAALASNEPVKSELIRFETSAWVEVDLEGRIVSIAPDAKLPVEVAKAVRGRIEPWRFEPVTLNGRAVIGATYVRLMACAAPVNGAYQMAFRYLGAGPLRQGPMVPTYPYGMIRAGRSAELTVAFRAMADGSAVLEDIKFGPETGKRDQRALRKVVEDWMKSLSFQPEQLDGRAVTTRISWPVKFTSERSQTQTFSSLAAAQASAAKREQQNLAEDKTCQAAMAAPASEGSGIAMDSPFKLLPSG